MSFLCSECHKAQPPHTQPRIVPDRTRRKCYPERRNRDDVVIDKGGTGLEIVREAWLCPKCIAKRKAETTE